MPHWKELESWIDEFDVDSFSVHNVPFDNASAYISSYVSAQRYKSSKTKYILKRDGRTTKAVWSVGHKRLDFNNLSHTLYEDIEVKVIKAWIPDAEKMAVLNPNLLKKKEEMIGSVIEGALRVLSVSLNS